MIVFNWKFFLKSLGIFAFCVFVILSIQKYINNQVIIRTQNIIELYAKEEAEYKLEYSNKLLDMEEKYKKELVEIREQLEKAKILIEKMKKEKKYTSMIKNDVNSFMKEVDKILGIKGKPNVKK